MLTRIDLVEPEAPTHGQRISPEAVREALNVLWEAADRICGKRFKPLLPSAVRKVEKFLWRNTSLASR